MGQRLSSLLALLAILGGAAPARASHLAAAPNTRTAQPRPASAIYPALPPPLDHRASARRASPCTSEIQESASGVSTTKSLIAVGLGEPKAPQLPRQIEHSCAPVASGTPNNPVNHRDPTGKSLYQKRHRPPAGPVAKWFAKQIRANPAPCPGLACLLTPNGWANAILGVVPDSIDPPERSLQAEEFDLQLGVVGMMMPIGGAAEIAVSELAQTEAGPAVRAVMQGAAGPRLLADVPLTSQLAQRELAAVAATGEKTLPEGSFSIVDWKGYPQNLPKPPGPFRLLEGSEYQEARDAANAANRSLHKADASVAGKDVHEIQPVKFGGSPIDPANKVALPRAEHAPATSWWKRLQRYIEEL